MLPIKKLYIDSRCKSPDSVSDSDFYIDLPETLLMPEGTGFYLDDISIPVTWYPITENKNNKIYIELYDLPQQFNPNRTTVTKTIVIEEGIYSTEELGSTLATAINSAFSGDNFSVTVNYLRKSEKYTIASSSGREWRILTDTEIEQKNDSKPFASINSVLQNNTPKLNTTSFTTGYINMYPIRNVYITSYGLGNFNTMSISGERAVVKKVPVTAQYKKIIFDQSVIGMDYLDCSKQTLSRIGFRLNTIYGEPIDLHGHHWSFSIVFSRIQEIM